MKLYGTKVPVIARDIIKQLTAAEQIEVNNREEAELDIQSVLKEYIRRDREIVEECKDMIEHRGISHGQFGKVKRMIADKKGHGLGEDGVLYMANQILETFMQSQFVEEIFATDSELRRKMMEIMKRHMLVDDELDEEVRTRIKNLEEGSAHWEVEYGRVMDQVKRKRGLTD